MNRLDLPQRKSLAHLPPVERHDRPVVLFVTFTVRPRGNFLASDLFHTVFLEACRDADAWSVGRYVIMPDHVHLFCAPARWPPVGIRRWAQYLKERVTKRLGAARLGAARLGAASPPRLAEKAGAGGRACGEPSSPKTGTVWRWQSDCWDTQMRCGDQYHGKWLYVRENPVRAGLAGDADAWPFQGELNVLRW